MRHIRNGRFSIGFGSFNSLDSADHINQLIGYPSGYGRVRWLAELWPDFRVYAGSTEGA
jgi:hypothetical protein